VFSRRGESRVNDTQLYAAAELIIKGADTSGITPDQFMTFLQSFSVLRCLRLDCLAGNIINRVFDWEGSLVSQLEELSWASPWVPERDYDLRNKFLKHCTGVRELYLERGDTVSADALIQLLGYPLLEVLHVEGWLEDDFQLQQRFFDGNPVADPFPSIKDLLICGEGSTIKPLLSSSPPTLVTLDLDICDNLDSILLTNSQLSNLVHLRIAFDAYRDFSRTDLDYISELSTLQQCHLDWGGPLPAVDGPDSSNYCP
jgi:hypothetical protein